MDGKESVGGPMASRQRVRILRAVGWTVLVGVGLEGGSRLDDRFRFGTPLLSPYRSRDELVVRDREGMHGRPNARFGKFVLNSMGTRGPEVTARKTAAVLRVVTAGASETFGLHELPGKEYPRQLEDSLRRYCPNRRPEVVNTAMPGMTLPTVIQDLRLRIGRLRPDVVVYYPTPAQYLLTRIPTAAAPDSSSAGPAAMGGFRLRSTARLAVGIRSLVPDAGRRWLRQRALQAAGDQAGSRFEQPPGERVAAFEQDLRSLVGSVHAIGAAPVLVPHANRFPEQPAELSSGERDQLEEWLRYAPRASGAALLGFEAAARQATLSVAMDSGATSVDLPALLRGEPSTLFADFSHFTDLGAAVVAGAIARAIARAPASHCESR
jgi:hypothetical protein